MLKIWTIVPTCLPLIVRRCHLCASDRFRASGKFRVNANHKLLDAWLLVLCAGCGDTAKLSLLERVNVRSVDPRLLDRLHGNDIVLTAELLQDPLVQHRNRVALDWTNAWRLDTSDPLDDGGVDAGDGSDPEVLDVSVRFGARIPVRPVRLIADGCGLARAEIERLIEAGKLVAAVRLGGKISSDFTFTLKR
ncbi:DUF1062 domain-containing protein [Actinoplanes solisilvae]|uniref:DUF1062 domain-containing protein n=1 Tax=Actinoplanes solisilvae TaxID=2486853 RepID=UPI000FDB5A17|nr:DUF1062 domain-containing protein [Actinoplanes solisilvae]